LETLSRDTGEPFSESLTKAEAFKRIDELRSRSPRLAETAMERVCGVNRSDIGARAESTPMVRATMRPLAPESTDEQPPRNRLLQALSPSDRARLHSELRTVALAPRLVLQRAHEPVREIFFPDGGVVSVTTLMTDGAIVEVATIGSEGLVGIDAVLGGEAANAESMVQVPGGTATVLSAETFRREMARGGTFSNRVHRYTQGLMGLIMQSVGCLAVHSVHQRCCRWLLMAHDRVGHDEFQLSQEFLAAMIGSTRTTVNAVASALQKCGVIRYVHGRLTILDRARLERDSCECYATVRDNFARLQL
jgi:CRP-like cAMP-binding protein